jgi:hypothetical protein
MSFNVLVVVVILNALATIALWRNVARKPEKLRKQFIKALLHSEPIEPKHRQPKTIGEGWGVHEEDRKFFTDFADFADVANWWFSRPHVGEPWRLQELPDTGLKLDFSDEPTYGRRYDIYHNQVQVGKLELSTTYLSENKVFAQMNLERVRLLPISTIRALLNGLALHICDPDRTSDEYRQGRIAIDGCLTDTLWQSQRISEFDVQDGDLQDYGDLDLQLEGSAKWYFGRRGSGGFAEWKGQRQ